MLGPALPFVMQAVLLAGGAATYEQAYKDAQASGRPILVLVGAEWCPSCQSMKQGVLARMRRAGELARVKYAEVDFDERAELAGQLMRGGAIPQLIAFSQGADGKWHREQVTGPTSEAGVRSLIEHALTNQGRPQKASDGAIGN